ncbi:MAG: hypothetical protein ACN4E6_09845, partial [Qipengyuania pacifica]
KFELKSFGRYRHSGNMSDHPENAIAPRFGVLSWQAARLIGALETKAQSPDDAPPPETRCEDPSAFTAPLFFGARYLLDRELPFKWRFRLFWWMTARFYYALMFARERNAR